jgi:hypothetical protein
MKNLAEQLQSARLKKVPQTRSESTRLDQTNAFLTEPEIKAYQANVLDCNAENWYEILGDCTFETRFCPLYKDEAQFFIDVYGRLFKDKALSEIEVCDWRGSLTTLQKETLERLEARLELRLSEFIDADGYAFVKTSSRSAKDSPLATKQFKALYESYLRGASQPTENEKIVCLLRAAFECLRVKSAAQVIDMFIKSERIYQDMALALENPSRFNENFVIRKFEDIDVDMEFRGFVFANKLNALSQYNYLIFSQCLHDNQAQIQSNIIDFFYNVVLVKLVKSGFMQDFVIDFAILKSTGSFNFLFAKCKISKT